MSASTMPAHMSLATELPSGAVAAACSWYVIHRNAPGAISAIALTVTPVRPSVAFTCGCSWAIRILLFGGERLEL